MPYEKTFAHCPGAASAPGTAHYWYPLRIKTISPEPDNANRHTNRYANTSHTNSSSNANRDARKRKWVIYEGGWIE